MGCERVIRNQWLTYTIWHVITGGTIRAAGLDGPVLQFIRFKMYYFISVYYGRYPIVVGHLLYRDFLSFIPEKIEGFDRR